MPYRAVVFDLDGTLLDTLDDIAGAANAALADAGFPTHPAADYRRFIGDGVAVLFRRALPPDAADDPTIAGCVAAFETTYGDRWNDLTRPYEGIPALLDALVDRGVALALLSNKPDAFTRLCADAYLAAWPFAVVLGARDDVPRKPDPAGAIELAGRMGLPPSAFAYVGDTAVDMETARRAGMFPVGVSWGFRPVSELTEAGARVVIDHPAELLDVLDRHDPGSAG